MIDWVAVQPVSTAVIHAGDQHIMLCKLGRLRKTQPLHSQGWAVLFASAPNKCSHQYLGITELHTMFPVSFLGEDS